MDKKQIKILDGSKEQREKIMKEFFGLKPDQSFQDLDVNVEGEDE